MINVYPARGMYFSTLKRATTAYHFSVFIYRDSDDKVGIVDYKNGVFGVIRASDAKTEGLEFIEPPVLDFSTLTFDEMDESLGSQERAPLWDVLLFNLSRMDRELLIFIIQREFPIELFIRCFLARERVGTDNRPIEKRDAYTLWNPDKS